MIDSRSTTFYPPNEKERLAAVRRYDILDTPPDRAFDRVAAIAARLFHVPIAIISIVDSDRIWFKSHHGLELEQIGRDPGLCASVILQNDVYSVLDASIDLRTLANRLVAGEFGLRFYAAAPLRAMDSFNLGTICVIDFQPRPALSEMEKATLQDLAAIVIDELELRLVARKTVELEVGLRTEFLKNEQAHKRAFATDERLLAALDQIQLLREQVECLKLQMEDKDLELQETLLEFKHTNSELCTALMSKPVSLAEALELATEILTSKRYANKSLSQLLNAIYDSKVKPEELGEIDRSSVIRMASSSTVADKKATNFNQEQTYSDELKAKFNELLARFFETKAIFQEKSKAHLEKTS